jgi:hypothetical protein
VADFPADAHWSGEFDIPEQLWDLVLALTTYRGQLIVGGDFIGTQNISLYCIGIWTGSEWRGFGTGVTAGVSHGGCPGPPCWPSVEALLVHEDDLIVGGNFIKAAGRPANYIAKWDGTSWSTLGQGMNGPVYALAEYHGEIVAGGDFTTADGLPAQCIARWNGWRWEGLGAGVNGLVDDLTIFRDQLVAGGFFSLAGGRVAYKVAAWDGLEWHALGSGSLGNVTALEVWNDALIVSGAFRDPGDVYDYGLAAWDGTSWTRVLPREFSALHSVDLAVYRGALVKDSFEPGYVVRTNGTTVESFGSGTNDRVVSMCATEKSLYVGGWFTEAGGKRSPHVARWDDILTPVEVEALEARSLGGGVLVTWRLSRDGLDEVSGVEVESAVLELGPYETCTPHPLQPDLDMSFLYSPGPQSEPAWYRLRILEAGGGTSFAGPVRFVPDPSMEGMDLSVSVAAVGPVTVRYRLGHPTPGVSLDVYSATGRLVRNLASGARPIGAHAVAWDRRAGDGARVARGVYFVQLRAGRALARKVLLQ